MLNKDLRILPKVELHLHLDCCLSFEVVKKINPQIEEKFKLQDASKALDKILNRGTKGKVVLYP